MSPHSALQGARSEVVKAKAQLWAKKTIKNIPPPPPSSELLAALTMQSISSLVMLPVQIDTLLFSSCPLRRPPQHPSFFSRSAYPSYLQNTLITYQQQQWHLLLPTDDLSDFCS